MRLFTGRFLGADLLPRSARFIAIGAGVSCVGLKGEKVEDSGLRYMEVCGWGFMGL